LTHSDTATCYLCGKVIDDPAGQWCFGCRHFICDDHLLDPWGGHKPTAHDTDSSEDIEGF